MYKIKHNLRLKPSHRDGKHQVLPPHKAAKREASMVLVKISASCLSISMYFITVPLLNMVSQEVVSHFDVFHTPMETGFWARHMALELSLMRGTLLQVTP
jgi:hypothetical protein